MCLFLILNNDIYACKAYHLGELLPLRRNTWANFLGLKRNTWANFLNICGGLCTGKKDEELLILCEFEAGSTWAGC